MPELPEVTTIVSDLNQLVRGKVIKEVSGDTPKLIKPLSFVEFGKRVKGLIFLRFERRGKYVIGYLGKKVDDYNSSTQVLVWHMRMTGHLLFRDEKKENKEVAELFNDSRNQFIRFSILFTDNTHLDFSDMRKFGTLHLFVAEELESCKGVALLGPDALLTKWKPEKLKNVLTKRKLVLKQALLDQSVIAGIGNIYADEILWTAKLHPLLKTSELSTKEVAVLLKAIRVVLKKAIVERGSSVDDYRDAFGRKGKYANFHRVYRRTNKPCFRCGKKIVRITVNGRGTHFCPVCQKLKTRRSVGSSKQKRQNTNSL